MEIKINREIRNYTESMFFGLSMRQFIFAVIGCGMAVLLYLCTQAVFRCGNAVVDVYARCGSVYRLRLCNL